MKKGRYLALIGGNSSAYSKSPALWNRAFRELNYPFKYQALDAPTEKDFDRLVSRLKSDVKFLGGNITSPWKEKIAGLCDGLEGGASLSRSVNTWCRGLNGFYGWTTDGEGAWEAISKITFPKRALLLGAGGASRSIALSLLSRGVLVDVSLRIPEKERRFGERAGVLLLELDPERIKWGEYDLIVNATPHADLPALSPFITKTKDSCLHFDLHYGFKEGLNALPWLTHAREIGRPVLDGSALLLHQAVKGFRILFPEVEESRLMAWFQEEMGSPEK